MSGAQLALAAYVVSLSLMLGYGAIVWRATRRLEQGRR